MTPLYELRETLQYLAEALRVRRCHTEPVHHAQTVGEHSCGVAVLCHLLTEGQASADLLLAAVTHDLGERRWGDMPGHVKVELGLFAELEAREQETLLGHGLLSVRKLGEADRRTLELADKLDLALYCCVERAQGNQLVSAMLENVVSSVRRFQPLSPREAEVFLSIKSIWRNYDKQGN